MSKTLHEDLAEMLHIVGYVQKDAVNKFHNYKYASADAVFTKVREELSKRGICITRDPELSGVSWQNGEGTNVIYDWVGYLCKGTERVTMCGTGQGSDKTDKAVMKAETAALKYALSGTFLISWGDDPEAPAEGSDESKASKKSKPTVPKKPRGATQADAVDIKPVIAKIAECKSVEELEKLAAAAKRLTIREQDRPVLREAYKEKHKELSK